MCLPLVLVGSVFLSQSPSVAVAVIRPGEKTTYRVTGMAQLETRRAATAKTNYRLASVTKHFTAAAILELVAEKKITLDTTLADVWPDFSVAAGNVTVRQMLTHQSGLQDYEAYLPPGDGQVSDDDVLRILKGLQELRFAPGTKFDYSNSAYVLLGKIVEEKSGAPLRVFLEQRIFQPLGMDGCVMHEAGKSVVVNRAFGYSPRGPRGWKQTDQSRTSATLGDGGIYCSLVGLEKWLASGRAMPVEMIEPQKLANGELTEYGFGWFVKPDRVWHTGETMGFRNAIVHDRATGATAIVLTNQNNAKAKEIAEKALAELPGRTSQVADAK